MNKVYLLLRNNHKTGPHSLEEFTQMGLKPLDLIWIEGKSLTWSYPSEIGVLKPYVLQAGDTNNKEPAHEHTLPAAAVTSTRHHQAFMPPSVETTLQPAEPPVKKIYVSMPVTRVAQAPSPSPSTAPKTAVVDIEQKAEELRKRIQDNTASTKQVLAEPSMQVKVSRSVGDLEEDYTSWMFNQQSKKKSNSSWIGIAGAIGAVLILGAGFGISRYDFSKNEPIAQTLVESEALIIPVDQPGSGVAPVFNEQEASAGITAPPPVQNNSYTTNTEREPVIKKNVKILSNQAPQKNTASIEKVREAVKENETTADQTVTNSIPETRTETVEPASSKPGKKKTLGKAFSGFFGKFKRKAEVEPNTKTTNETSSGKTPAEKPEASTQDAGTERKARRRSDEINAGNNTPVSTPVEKVHLEEMVDITSNEPAEKWMLGIHGVKLTIHNRSTEMMRTAAVEVRYYNEQHEMLDKKLVNFANVPSSKSSTLPVPDHRLADHTDYRIITASN
ncbi:MAG: hypothetical protein WKF89_05150 [Chitinophagaceae bacterium]